MKEKMRGRLLRLRRASSVSHGTRSGAVSLSDPARPLGTDNEARRFNMAMTPAAHAW